MERTLLLEAADHGAITLQDDDGNVFKANGQRLKIFLEPKMPQLEEVDVFKLHEVVRSHVHGRAKTIKEALYTTTFSPLKFYLISPFAKKNLNRTDVSPKIKGF